MDVENSIKNLIIEAAPDEWTLEQVATWLQIVGLEDLIDSFVDNDVTGDLLGVLDHNLLKELGVLSLGRRLKVLLAIKELNGLSQSTSQLSQPTKSEVNETSIPIPPPRNRPRSKILTKNADSSVESKLAQLELSTSSTNIKQSELSTIPSPSTTGAVFKGTVEVSSQLGNVVAEDTNVQSVQVINKEREEDLKLDSKPTPPVGKESNSKKPASSLESSITPNKTLVINSDLNLISSGPKVLDKRTTPSPKPMPAFPLPPIPSPVLTQTSSLSGFNTHLRIDTNPVKPQIQSRHKRQRSGSMNDIGLPSGNNLVKINHGNKSPPPNLPLPSLPLGPNSNKSAFSPSKLVVSENRENTNDQSKSPWKSRLYGLFRRTSKDHNQEQVLEEVSLPFELDEVLLEGEMMYVQYSQQSGIPVRSFYLRGSRLAFIMQGTSSYGIINLLGLRINTKIFERHHSNAFSLYDKDHTYIFGIKNPQLYEVWINTLEQCISNQIRTLPIEKENFLEDDILDNYLDKSLSGRLSFPKIGERKSIEDKELEEFMTKEGELLATLLVKRNQEEVTSSALDSSIISASGPSGNSRATSLPTPNPIYPKIETSQTPLSAQPISSQIVVTQRKSSLMPNKQLSKMESTTLGNCSFTSSLLISMEEVVAPTSIWKRSLEEMIDDAWS